MSAREGTLELTKLVDLLECFCDILEALRQLLVSFIHSPHQVQHWNSAHSIDPKEFVVTWRRTLCSAVLSRFAGDE